AVAPVAADAESAPVAAAAAPALLAPSVIRKRRRFKLTEDSFDVADGAAGDESRDVRIGASRMRASSGDRVLNSFFSRSFHRERVAFERQETIRKLCYSAVVVSNSRFVYCAAASERRRRDVRVEESALALDLDRSTLGVARDEHPHRLQQHGHVIFELAAVRPA